MIARAEAMLGNGETLVRLSLVMCGLFWLCIASSSAQARSSGFVALDEFIGSGPTAPIANAAPSHDANAAEEYDYRPLPPLTPGRVTTQAPDTGSTAQFFRLREMIELTAQPPPERPDLPFRWDDQAAPATEVVSTRAAPGDPPVDFARRETPSVQTGIHGLRSLIGWAEAGRAGYDAVVLSARIKPPKPPTEMTLHEIFLWIERTPRQNHAIGRYQFIPNTLRRLVSKLDVSHSQQFDPALQDRLANALLIEAGLVDFIQRQLSRKGFMNNLADIWAGLPTSNGKSRYHGYAGNKAVITWHRFAQAMALYFPP